MGTLDFFQVVKIMGLGTKVPDQGSEMEHLWESGGEALKS